MVLDVDEVPDVPPFSGLELLKLHNAGFADAVARLRAGASRDDRGWARDHFIRLAGTLTSTDVRHLATSLHERMGDLLRRTSLRLMPIPGIDTVDGALSAALLVAGWKLVNRATVARALEARRRSTEVPRNAELPGRLMVG